MADRSIALSRPIAGIGMAVLLTLVGCQSQGSPDIAITLGQTPPTVQAAFEHLYAGSTIKQVVRSSLANQDYYTVKFIAANGTEHTVEMNEAGDEIENH